MDKQKAAAILSVVLTSAIIQYFKRKREIEEEAEMERFYEEMNSFVHKVNEEEALRARRSFEEHLNTHIDD